MNADVKFKDYKEVEIKPSRRKSVKNGLLSIMILLVLALSSGSAYVYYIDQHNKPVVSTAIADSTLQFHSNRHQTRSKRSCGSRSRDNIIAYCQRRGGISKHEIVSKCIL